MTVAYKFRGFERRQREDRTNRRRNYSKFRRKAEFKMSLESFGRKKLRIKNKYVREFFAEFLGIFILMVFGLGVNAQDTLNRGKATDSLAVSWGWGLAVAMGVWVSGGVSGGHLNPAVSLAMMIVGKLKVRQLPVYWLAQYLGAFAASATVYVVYSDALKAFDGGIREVTGENATAGIWATYPREFLSIMGGFTDQVFGTMLLLLGIFAVTDERNMSPPKGLIPFVVGLIIFLIGLSFAWNCGYALNPARDLSPRLFTAIAGWGSKTFSHGNYWFWIPLVATHVGGILGALIYLSFVGFHNEDDNEYDVDSKPVALREVRGHHNSEFNAETKADNAAHF